LEVIFKLTFFLALPAWLLKFPNGLSEAVAGRAGVGSGKTGTTQFTLSKLKSLTTKTKVASLPLSSWQRLIASRCPGVTKAAVANLFMVHSLQKE